MQILHISNDFSNTKVHSNLFKRLDKLGIRQTIFNPIIISRRGTIGCNEFSANQTSFIYADIVKPYHRYVYHIKRRDIFQALEERVDLKEIDLVNATTLFSDGGQAYKIHKKYGIPYIVSVRNTDINGFLDKLPNTWVAGYRILSDAKKIIFISKALMSKFANHKVIKPILPKIQDKMLLIPNGIDDYYLDHISHNFHGGHKVIYVGDFSDNKNVKRLCEAVLWLKNEKGLNDVSLTLVGGGKNKTNKIQAIIDQNPDVFHYTGPVYDKAKLCELYAGHSLFAMPSIHETFGLVYIEALTQILPIIYTKGQGVDGLFDNTVGEKVNPTSVQDITNALHAILMNPYKYSNDNVDFSLFKWSMIAEKYLELFKSVIDNKSVSKINVHIV